MGRARGQALTVFAALASIVSMLPIADAGPAGDVRGVAFPEVRDGDQGLMRVQTIQAVGAEIRTLAVSEGVYFDWQAQAAVPRSDGQPTWTASLRLANVSRQDPSPHGLVVDLRSGLPLGSFTKVHSKDAIDYGAALDWKREQVDVRVTLDARALSPCLVVGLQFIYAMDSIELPACRIGSSTVGPERLRRDPTWTAPFDGAVLFRGERDPTLLIASPAYPFPLLVAQGLGAGRFDVALLERFARGTLPYALDEPIGRAPVPLPTLSPRDGPFPPEGQGGPPFTLAEALTRARTDPTDSRVHEFLSQHPASYVEAARHYADREESPFETWHVILAADGERLPFSISKIVTRPGPPAGSPPAEAYHRFQCCVAPAHWGPDLSRPPVPEERLPDLWPTIGWMHEVWATHFRSEPETRDYTSWWFQLRDAEGPRADPLFELGTSAPSRLRDSSSPAISRVTERYMRLLSFDVGGNLQSFTVRGIFTGTDHAAASTLDQLVETPTGESYDARLFTAATTTETRDWTRWDPFGFEEVVAISLAAAATLTLGWGVRHAFTAPFFARFRPEAAVQHAVRARILTVVGSTPGVRFREMVRLIGRPEATVRHHLAYLVRLNVLVRVESGGFTSYFRPGQVDRVLLRATSALRTRGTREILAAVAVKPGVGPAAVAEGLGLHRSTVDYHLSRLAGIGLVELDRVGGRIVLRPTETALRALAASA